MKALRALSRTIHKCNLTMRKTLIRCYIHPIILYATNAIPLNEESISTLRRIGRYLQASISRCHPATGQPWATMNESASPLQEVTEQELIEQNHKNLIQIKEAGDHLVEKYWKGRMRYICHAYQNEVLPK